jgi:membrane protein required for colicin V production
MIIDIIVGALLLISAIIAFIRGFIREVLTIMGVVGGLIAAYLFGGAVAVQVRKWLGVEDGAEQVEKLFDIIPYTLVADVLAYGGVFIVVVIILSIASHFLAESVRNLGLGAVDRSLGALFGLARGVLLLGLVYVPIHIGFDSKTVDEWFKGSRSHVYLEMVAKQILTYVPDAAREDAADEIESLREGVEQTNDTRRKLEEMDLLGGRGGRQGSREENSEAEKRGYTDEFRQEMDRLFEDAAPDLASSTPAPAPASAPKLND